MHPTNRAHIPLLTWLVLHLGELRGQLGLIAVDIVLPKELYEFVFEKIDALAPVVLSIYAAE